MSDVRDENLIYDPARGRHVPTSVAARPVPSCEKDGPDWVKRKAQDDADIAAWEEKHVHGGDRSRSSELPR